MFVNFFLIYFKKKLNMAEEVDLATTHQINLITRNFRDSSLAFRVIPPLKWRRERVPTSRGFYTLRFPGGAICQF